MPRTINRYGNKQGVYNIFLKTYPRMIMTFTVFAIGFEYYGGGIIDLGWNFLNRGVCDKVNKNLFLI